MAEPEQTDNPVKTSSQPEDRILLEGPHSRLREARLIFIAIKDLSHGIIGKAVDGTMEGPAYLKGYEPKQRPVARRGSAQRKI